MGTLSETYMAVYDDDPAALEAFRLHFPSVGFVALPDGDPLHGVARLAPFKDAIRIVRVDHWDLVQASTMVREALDEHGMGHVKILGSGSLNEAKMERVISLGAPVDFFGVGREVAVGGEGSGVSLAYRLAEIFRGVSLEGVTRPGASMYPCRKQIVRGPSGDVLCLADEADGLQVQGGTPMLEPMVVQGERLVEAEDPTVAASRCVTQLERLPEGVRRLQAPDAWPLQVSDGLAAAALR